MDDFFDNPILASDIETESLYSPSACSECSKRSETTWIGTLRTIISWFSWARLKWLMIRAILLFIFGSSILLTSVLTYSLIYWYYMPTMQYEFPVYFQYDNSHGKTSAIAEIRSLDHAFQMRSGVAYDFMLDLSIPDVPGLSEKVGNFMLTLGLYDDVNEPWFTESRPALLPYRSDLVRKSTTLIKLAPIICGWAEERIKKRIFLSESVIKPCQKLCKSCSKIKIALSDASIPIFNAKLLVTAHLKGLRRIMYHWRITSAFGFTFITSLAQFNILLVIFIIWKARSRRARRASLLRDEVLIPENISDEFDNEEAENKGLPVSNGLRKRRHSMTFEPKRRPEEEDHIKFE